MEWLARCAFAAGAILALVAGVWTFPPIWTGYVLAGTLPVAMVRAWGRTASAQYDARLKLWLGRVTLAATAACAALTWFYGVDPLRGWLPPQPGRTFWTSWRSSRRFAHSTGAEVSGRRTPAPANCA